MRSSLWVFAVLVAAGCSSSGASEGAPPLESGHPEGLPDDSEATQNASESSDGTGDTGGDPPPGPAGGSGGDGNSLGGTANPAQDLPGCETWPTAPPSLIRASIADSNGTVSAVRAIESLGLGLAPAPSEIRLDDFFNHYDSGPAAVTPANVMTLNVSMALRARVIPGQYDLFVGIRTGTPPRPRSVLTIVVDTTPSMTGMPIARADFAVEALARALQKGDKVVLLTTDQAQGTKTFDIVDTGAELELAAKSLTVSNEANVPAALTTAYERANESFDPTALNRVVFVSDGAEPLSALPTSEISAGAAKGIFLVGVGVGPTTSYRERLLDHATFQGRGSTLYVFNAASAEEQLHLRYDQIMGIVYDDVRLQLELPWYLHRIDETTTSGAGEHKAQYLAPGAALTFLFRLQACNKDAFLKEPSVMTATVLTRDPATQQEGTAMNASVSAEPLEQLAPEPGLDKAVAIQSYVEALRSLDLKRVQRAKEAVGRAESADPDVQDITTNVLALEQLLTH